MKLPIYPDYDLDKIKYGTDAPTFEKAVGLYEKKKVTKFMEGIRSYSAVVLGTTPYRVLVEARKYDYGHCECYLGEKEILCKHMVALAIYAINRGKPLSEEDKQLVTQPSCSGKIGKLSPSELSHVKKSISNAILYIKAYNGPSSTWFFYQSSLSEGCKRMAKIFSDLPISEHTAKLVIDTLLRLDKKLCQGGVDDSDGTVGDFIQETIEMLKEYAKIDPKCLQVFQVLKSKETCFGWEEPLLKIKS